MASSVHGDEGESVELDVVSCNLLVNGPGCPWLLDAEAQVPDELLRAHCGADAVVVTRVDDKLEVVSHKELPVVHHRLVDVSLVVVDTTAVDPLRAHLGVDRLLHLRVVQVCHLPVCVTRLVRVREVGTQLASSLLHCAHKRATLVAACSVAGGAHREVERVRVEARGEVLEAVLKVVAGGAVLVLAAVREVLVPLRLREERVSCEGGELTVVAVGHVGEGVAEEDSCEVCDLRLLDKHLGEGGHVVSSVRLGGDVELLVLEGGEALKQAHDEGVVVVGCLGIARLLVLGEAEADACGLLNEHHVCKLVPRMRVSRKAAVGVRAEGSLLGHESTKPTASRASVGPHNDGVGGGVALGLGHPVEDLLFPTDRHVPAEHLEGHASRDAGQVVDLISSGGRGVLGRHGAHKAECDEEASHCRGFLVWGCG